MMKDERMKTGDPKQLLIQLSIPAICVQVVTLLYNTVDRIYIGRMADGTMAMAGIGLCMPITMVLSGLSALFGRGGSPLAAISLGKDDREEAELFLGNSFFSLVFTSFVVMAATLTFQKPLLTMFGASENTMVYAAGYLTIYLYGTLFVQITVGMNYFITTQGFAKTAMVTTMLGAVLNIVLDPISMFQFINLPLTGVAQGSQPIVSFNYGAKDYGRIRQTLRYAAIACTSFSLCGTTLMMLFPSFFIRLFNKDPQLVELGARMLRVYISGCFFIGANSLYQQTYTSMGEGKMSFFFAFFRKVILLIPLLYILPEIFPWGVMAVALAEPVSDLLTTLCNKIYFGRFLRRKLGAGK